MLAAMLDRTVVLERAALTADASGGRVATYGTQAAGIRAALWSKASARTTGFARPDFLGTHVIATNVNYGVRPGDRFNAGGTYYLVESVDTWANAAVSTETVYVHNVTLRTP